MSQDHAKIVVAGDPVVDWLQVECPARVTIKQNWHKVTGFRWHQTPGGAMLVARLLGDATDLPVSSYDINAPMESASGSILHSLALIGEDEEAKNSDGVLRVRKFLGYSPPFSSTGAKPELLDDPKDASIVVLDDAGNGFRDNPAAWPAAITSDTTTPEIILKMSHPLARGVLWDHLVVNHSNRLNVIVSVDDLRILGANISRRLSWERTVSDLVWQLAHNPNLRPLTAAATLIIRIGIDGALVLRCGEKKREAIFFFDPRGYEDEYKSRFSGDMQGLTPAFVAAFARSLASKSEDRVRTGVREGITASRRLFRLGYGTNPRNPEYPGRELFAPAGPADAWIEDLDLYDLDTIETDPGWTILQLLRRSVLETLAGQIVREGVDSFQKSIPIARFKNLVVVDREEIESFQSIRNLLSEYINNAEIRRPFSFVVFGPPGSGKSFGVTELSKDLAPEKIASMTFNLSQFESTDDLSDAFHLIRDAALEGKLPLVFFDEFDTRFGGQQLGWLRFFLAPMQDGIFKDGESTHPIGRAIFVFAGGTSASFADFENRVGTPDDPSTRDAKATDFISRLRGKIDIRGCNPAPNDTGRCLVRRAFLLRSTIERSAKDLVSAGGKVEIHEGVLRAFLKIPAYRHGVRSMQAIVEMSMLKNRKSFEPAAIPPNDQLALHVNEELFRLLMLQDVLFERMVEPLAQAVHREYRAHVLRTTSGMLPPNAVAWDELSEEFKESNRDHARTYKAKLQEVGCAIGPMAMGVARTVTEFTDDQVDQMARVEHERWMAEKKQNDWVYGPDRDNEKKIHPDLLSWGELSDAAKEKDRNAARTTPKLLAEAGFAIYPML